jgi:hypothetical protein
MGSQGEKEHMKLKAYLLATGLALASLTASTTGFAQATPFKLNDVIPATLTVTDAAGKNHEFSSFRGKPVVLEWTNYDCPFVKKHYGVGNMQKLQKDYTAKGVTWLSVISSAPGKQGALTAAEAPKAIEDAGFSGTAVVLDPSGTLGRQFGAETTPHMFVLDATGKLVYRGAIDSIPSFNADDIQKADNYVAQALDAVLVGKSVATAQTKAYGCSVKY